MSSTRSNVSLPEDAITGRADRRPALESAAPARADDPQPGRNPGPRI